MVSAQLAAVLIPIACASATKTAIRHFLSRRRRHLAATRRNGTMLTRPRADRADHESWT